MRCHLRRGQFIAFSNLNDHLYIKSNFKGFSPRYTSLCRSGINTPRLASGIRCRAKHRVVFLALHIGVTTYIGNLFHTSMYEYKKNILYESIKV